MANSYWKVSDSIPMLFRDSKTGKVTRLGGVPAKPGIDFKNPMANRITVSDILKNDSKTPQAPKYQGKVDLGEGYAPRPGSGTPEKWDE